MVDLTPAHIVTTLSEIGRRLDNTAAEVERLDGEHVALKAEFRREYARAFLAADGSNDVRRYKAEASTADLWEQVEVAEQVLRAAKEALRVLRDRLEIGRSLSAVMRLEWGTS